MLFPVDKDGTINPNVSNIPGLEALATADLMIVALRFRDLPDEQMKHFVDYVESGKPIMGLRTATHSFNIKGDKTYAKYSWGSNDVNYKQGFGRQVHAQLQLIDADGLEHRARGPAFRAPTAPADRRPHPGCAAHRKTA
mgnify:CR=1 FL=1